MSKRSWLKRAVAVFAVCTATAIASSMLTFTTLVSFEGSDGRTPFAGLVQGPDGDLYGTAQGGGANYSGTVFKISPTGTLKTLYSFCSQANCTDGGSPRGGLVLGTDGNFYGTTAAGGGTSPCPFNRLGCGTAFRITPGGVLTTLYRFCAQTGCADGTEPLAGLVQAIDGNFYGTTPFGGGATNGGTVFKITPQGTPTTLYSFVAQAGGTVGYEPIGPLVQGTDGILYGTTAEGGTNGELGTIFKITLSGVLTTLHSFDGTDGETPESGLAPGADGNFYGTVLQGGDNNYGTVFKITPQGILTTLHLFDGADGSQPAAGLVQATDGAFYGTTFFGGTSNVGVIFTITPQGTLTTLRSFDRANGTEPTAGLLEATDGTLYGTTSSGGIVNQGSIFSLSVGLGPFVATVPNSGKVGTLVTILGTNLTGATSVTFNGTPATFNVVSGTEISASVPVGATSGKVQVVTPSGTLSSNVPFRVLP